MQTKSSDEKLDALARSLAQPMPRRRAVGVLIAGLFGFGLNPRRAFARDETFHSALGQQLHDTPCVDSMCSSGKICGVFSLPNRWGQKGCIKLGCCAPNQFCCAGEATAHGAVGGCCSKGFNCDDGHCVCNGTLDFKSGCVCPPDRLCGPGCCKEGDSCVDNECCPPERVCGTCCKKGEQCVHGECKPYCETEPDRRKSHVYDPATQCCTKNGIQQKYPIQNFEACRETRVERPGYKPDQKDLYCGPKGKRFPDHYGNASFLPACVAHDLCYSKCGSSKSTCDQQFTKTITSACKAAYGKDAKVLAGCLSAVDDYNLAVTVGASIVGAYDDAQSEACQCCA